jgi:hypothetical protein
MGALIIAFASQSFAMQNMHSDSACTTMVSRTYGFISPGLTWVNNNDLNSFLGTEGIASFNTMSPTFSLGGHREMKRLIMESNLNFRYWRDNVDNGLRTSLFASDIVCNTGINVLPATMPVTLFPYLGLGAGLNTLHFRRDTKTLAQVLTFSGSDAMLWQASFLINLGLGADFILAKADGTHGLVLGLRGGYLFDPYNGDKDWNLGGTEVEDVPNFKQSGPYVRLILGGWGTHKHKHMDHSMWKDE